jgi:uncharacterized membrane protein
MSEGPSIDRPEDQGEAASVGSDTGRLETFADGVIAIAITLLILEVKVPEPAGTTSLTAALLKQWPSYGGYAVSFLTIGVIWVNHHHMFKLIARTNHAFLILNVVFLMAIAFLPWPTALVAAYMQDPAGRAAAAFVYALTMVAIAVMFNLVWRYAVARGLLTTGLDPRAVTRAGRNYMLGPAVYGAATLIAIWAPFVTLGICGGLAVYWLLPGTGPRATLLGSAPSAG